MAEQGAPLAGFTVGVTAARRAEEQAALIRRRGGGAVLAPAMRTVPLADDTQLRAATRDLLAEAPDTVVATTAVGFRGWLEAAAGWGEGEALVERLRGARLYARGPKVTGAVRAAGLREEWAPGSESLAEVLERLVAEGVAGRRIAVQLHGEPLHAFRETLTAGGADIVAVPVYRWLPPLDPAPLDGLIAGIAARTVHAVTFTSAPAAASLLARAQETGRAPEVLEAFGHDVLAACVGSVTAAPLRERGVPTREPERFRLGPLVQLLCDELPARAAGR
jgi:uroporphyrinogen-III synthase